MIRGPITAAGTAGAGRPVLPPPSGREAGPLAAGTAVVEDSDPPLLHAPTKAARTTTHAVAAAHARRRVMRTTSSPCVRLYGFDGTAGASVPVSEL